MRPNRSRSSRHGAHAGARPRPWSVAGLALGILLASAVEDAGAQTPPSTDRGGEQLEPAAECCLVLLLPVGARSVSLGGALSASASPDAVFANPAGLATLESSHFVIHHTTLASQATAFSLLATPGRVGTVGVSYQLIDFGDIEYTNDLGQTTGSLSLRHHLLVASFATPVAGGLATGINYKLYQFRIGCRGLCGGEEVAATTHALDVGVRYRPAAVPALQLGAAVVNAGMALQVVNAQQADPLPARLRVGAAYEFLRHLLADSTITLNVAVEVEDEWRDMGDPRASVGAELAANDAVFLRAGYAPGTGVGTGASIGVGIRYGQFLVSVAKSFAATTLDPATEPMQVSFGVSF